MTAQAETGNEDKHQKIFCSKLAPSCFTVQRSLFVYVFQVSFHAALLREYTRTDVALVRLDVTQAVHCRQVSLHMIFSCKLLAANVTLMCSFARFGATSDLTVRRVVVSVDR